MQQGITVDPICLAMVCDFISFTKWEHWQIKMGSYKNRNQQELETWANKNRKQKKKHRIQTEVEGLANKKRNLRDQEVSKQETQLDRAR